MKLRLVALIVLANAAWPALGQGFAPAAGPGLYEDWRPLAVPVDTVSAAPAPTKFRNETYVGGEQLLSEVQARVAGSLERQLKQALADQEAGGKGSEASAN